MSLPSRAAHRSEFLVLLVFGDTKKKKKKLDVECQIKRRAQQPWFGARCEITKKVCHVVQSEGRLLVRSVKVPRISLTTSDPYEDISSSRRSA